MSGHRIYQTINLIILVCCSLCSNGQILNSKAKLSRADSLRQDFVLFKSTLQRKYPSLYRYSAPIKMNQILDSSYASINEKTTGFEFYKTIKTLLSKIKDGHLSCSLPPSMEKYIDEKAVFFPIQLRFIHHKVYAIADPQIPSGSEIISINGRPVDAVVNKLFTFIVADGNIQTKKYHVLNKFFYFYYFIAFGESGYFDITYKSSAGQIKKLSVKADPEKKIVANRRTDRNEPLLNFSINPDGIGLMRIQTFDPSAFKIDFSEFLKRSFRKIDSLKIKKLIIDLRGNGGGRDTYGSLLYSYLTNQPFKYYSSLQTVTADLEYEKFKSNVSSYNDLKPAMLMKDVNGNYRMKKEAHSNLQTQNPNAPYTGKVWFITDGLSFSTTAEFCAIAHSNKRGDFIGEETGGTYGGNTSGVQDELMLPNTKIGISFGTVRYEMSVNKNAKIDRGIIPKYKVEATIQDIMSNKDAVLTYAIWLAGRDRF